MKVKVDLTITTFITSNDFSKSITDLKVRYKAQGGTLCIPHQKQYYSIHLAKYPAFYRWFSLLYIIFVYLKQQSVGSRNVLTK